MWSTLRSSIAENRQREVQEVWKGRNMEQKIELAENGFWYQGAFRQLDERTILLDGSLTDEETTAGRHMYRDVREAFNAPELSGESPESPVTIYIAPDVYWIDDPEAVDVMQKREGDNLPFGVRVKSGFLRIEGLSENPENVVIAGNRGQSHACNGNYTMIHFQVEELWVSNLTLGNYCSVDLAYPLNPALNYPKRTDSITQAQLALQQGEKLYAKNCRFVSRLNLNPVCGAKRALYVNCHFESTDDALNGNAVYVGCDFDFYGGRPIFQARETGDVFIDCLFCSWIRGNEGECHQYLTKEGGPVTLIDCRYETRDSVQLGWTKYPEASLKCYQYQVSRNGQPVILGGENAPETVQLEGKKALEAYLFEQEGRFCANVGNLLGGSDGWDPAGALEQAKKAGKVGIPTLLTVSTDRDRVISGESAAVLIARAYLFSHGTCREKVCFSVETADRDFVKIRQSADDSCIVEGCNHGVEARKVIVHANTGSGLEAAAEITVEPYLLQAPVFIQTPYIKKEGRALTLVYQLSVRERADTSEISWYRCSRIDGAAVEGQSACQDNPEILCGISRPDHPLRTYRLTAADEGQYIKAVISPRVKGSLTGEAAAVITTAAVGAEDVDRKYLFTDFSGLCNENQRVVQRGRWTFDCGKPEDIEADSAVFGSWNMDESIPAWKYGETGNGSVGAGLYQNTQGARMRYTPRNSHGGDMVMTVKADPAKTAGQGFGSAGQYMDLGIKFDTVKLTGYALRVIRVKEASDAVAMALVEYREGRSRYLTALQKTSCFLTGCRISVALKGKKLTASAFTETPQPVQKSEKNYVHEVRLEAEVEGNPWGGILVWHTGTPGTGGWQNTTMLHSIEVTYGD